MPPGPVTLEQWGGGEQTVCANSRKLFGENFSIDAHTSSGTFLSVTATPPSFKPPLLGEEGSSFLYLDTFCV